MLLSGVIKAISNTLEMMVSEERNLQLKVMLDIRSGKIHFIDPFVELAHFHSGDNTDITIQIGRHEYRLGFDGAKLCVKERSLAQCYDEFLTLLHAQKALGFAGSNAIH